jgi:peptidoglycan hydrolase-like protein with peptidoglycan-binding domain
VKKLQQELGQLNYYEGPVDGLIGPQTVAAIKDLQRQAGLPPDRHHERRHAESPGQLPGPR